MSDDSTVDLDGLDSDYEILSELRQSRRSRTYLARHRGLNRDVTIRVEAAPRNGDNNSLTHFASDARTLTVMRHPNVVPVVEGRWLADRTFAIVRARVRGSSLDEAVGSDGPFPPSRIANTLAQVYSAIAWARGNGIAHRSLSGDSIIFQQGSGRVFVELDLSPLTAGGLPDECDDARTIGSLAYEMLVGRPIDDAPGQPLAELRPDLPPQVIREMGAIMNCDRHSPAPDPNVLIGLLSELPAPSAVRNARDATGPGVSPPSGSTEPETPNKPRFGFGTRLVILAAISTAVGATGSLLFTPAPRPVAKASESSGEVVVRRPAARDTIAASSLGASITPIRVAQAAVVRPTQPAETECESAAADDQHACLANAIARNDRELNDAYQRLAAVLLRRATIDSGGVTVDELNHAQQTWVDARDLACRNIGELPKYALLRAQCFAAASVKRSRELRKMLEAIAGS